MLVGRSADKTLALIVGSRIACMVGESGDKVDSNVIADLTLFQL